MNPFVLGALAIAALAMLTRKPKPTAAKITTASVKVPTSTGTAAATISLPKPTTITFPSSDIDYLNDAESESLLNDSLDDLYAEAIGSNHKVFIQAAAARLAASGDDRAIELAGRSATKDEHP